MRPAILRALVLGTCILGADQALQHTALADGYLGERRIAPFDPPVFCAWQVDALERIRGDLARGVEPPSSVAFDAQLGWCPTPDHESKPYRFDWAGARQGRAPLPRSRTPGVARAVAVGCSFTLAAEVGATEAWPALIDDAREDLEVANLGAPGFGLDQALLRLRRDGLRLEPDEVWLGVLPSAAFRNVTTYMPTMAHWSFPITFKPRFELNEDESLRLVPLPVRSLAEATRVIESQADLIAAIGPSDRWVRMTPAAYAPFGSSWLHRSSLARLALTYWEKRKRDPAPELRDPSSELYRLMLAIAVDLQRAARERNAIARVLVLPDRDDLASLDDAGGPYWRRWADDLRARGIDVFDVSPALVAAGGRDNAALWAPEAHYTAIGNRAVAEAIERHLRVAR